MYFIKFEFNRSETFFEVGLARMECNSSSIYSFRIFCSNIVTNDEFQGFIRKIERFLWEI